MFNLNASIWPPAYLSVMITLVSAYAAFGVNSNSPDGLYAQICGTGRMIFIPYDGGDKDPDPSSPSMMICHAISSQEDLDEDDATV